MSVNAACVGYAGRHGGNASRNDAVRVGSEKESSSVSLKQFVSVPILRDSNLLPLFLFGDATQILLAALMLVGRLGIVAVVLMFVAVVAKLRRG